MLEGRVFFPVAKFTINIWSSASKRKSGLLFEKMNKARRNQIAALVVLVVLLLAMFMAYIYYNGMMSNPQTTKSAADDHQNDEADITGGTALEGVLRFAAPSENSAIDDAKKKLRDAQLAIKEKQDVATTPDEMEAVLRDEAVIRAKTELQAAFLRLVVFYPSVKTERMNGANGKGGGGFFYIKDGKGGGCIDLDRYKEYVDWAASSPRGDKPSWYVATMEDGSVSAADFLVPCTDMKGYKAVSETRKVWSAKSKKPLRFEAKWTDGSILAGLDVTVQPFR